MLAGLLITTGRRRAGQHDVVPQGHGKMGVMSVSWKASLQVARGRAPRDRGHGREEVPPRRTAVQWQRCSPNIISLLSAWRW